MKKFICLNCGEEFYGYKERKYCSTKCYGEKSNKFKKYIGKKFGKLTILYGDDTTTSLCKKYYCKCDCGKIKSINMSQVINGIIKSCGCLQKEKTKKIKPNLKHGKSQTRIYKIWNAMKDRCYNENHVQYYLWGGKGIKVCDEWLNDFMNFYNWSMKNGYADNLSIDRIDGDKNYSPLNCRWSTKKQQARNINTNINVEYKGETHCLAEWSEILGIKSSTLYWRYKNWKDKEKIFNKSKWLGNME